MDGVEFLFGVFDQIGFFFKKLRECTGWPNVFCLLLLIRFFIGSYEFKRKKKLLVKLYFWKKKVLKN